MTTPRAGVWLVSARYDLTLLALGPALLALLLLLPIALGVWPADLDAPLWAYALFILGVDVAHVWATLYRVYLDPAELRRRRALYLGVPLATWFASQVLYLAHPAWFWTVLAYLAVYHFIRQQMGMVALYRARGGTRSTRARRLDDLAVLTGTLVPVLYWHAHLPRRFSWFIQGDFIGGLVPVDAFPALWLLYGGVAAAWLVARVRERVLHPGRDLTMLSTWLCWGVGIVVLDGDFAFLVTNVLLHGVPYVALVGHVTRGRVTEPDAPQLLRRLTGNALPFVGLLVVLAFVEEWTWNRTVWHEHAALFGSSGPMPAWLPELMVPLLTVPQAAHYVLDGFIWRLDGSNPGLRERLFGTAT